MKVPRSFSIAGVSDMASPRVREGPLVALAYLSVSSAAFVLANPWAATANQRGGRDGSFLAHARPCAHNAGRLREPRLPEPSQMCSFKKSEGTPKVRSLRTGSGETERLLALPTVARKPIMTELTR
jgi:hypothetical protein